MSDKYSSYSTDDLKKELEDFKAEKDRIRALIGQIGGNKYSKLDLIVNIVFFVVVIVMFLLEVVFHLLPSLMSLEIGVLLVSIKIVWMIHSQDKVNHFQFWVLNTIEYRLSELSKEIKYIKKKYDTK